ncbi:MAG: hypothetical protein C4584_00770 [Armatimonadetes bacterium]|nr:MAG: hypothetical protein C4584_00770 [Armatimonadota bacterium]
MDQMSAEARELMPRPDRPIVETAGAVSYLGVRLEKAANSDTPFVPKREQYADFINDEFSLEMQKTAATAFSLGQPLLVEGGTSIGKTTTMGKMAAELGWEFHYVNLKGSTDADELMGKYIPNANKKGSDDPEYIFADGKVATGLRREPGKKKIIVLDEYSSAHPNVAIRMHEVLDALGRNGNVVLTEDASESIPVNNRDTYIVALVNPPGKGYFGREPLDPAQLRRWVYIKAPSDLPEKTFSYATKSLFGLVPQVETVSESAFLVSRDQALLPEQLGEVPGITEIVARYEEFHRAAKQLVKERRIGADQPQLFTYDDRVEPKRIHDFVLSFFNGDITETFQAALKYYYANKVESPEDKAKLEELIAHVEYREIQQPSARRPISEPITPQPESIPSSEGRPGETVSVERAKSIMGNEFFGAEAIDKAFDIKILPRDIPPVPFSPEELETAKELGQFLILRLDRDSSGSLTMQKMQRIVQPKFDSRSKGKILYDPSWYSSEDFFTKDVPKARWVLVTKEVIPNSTSKNYLNQTQEIADYLKNQVFRGGVLPKEYQEAIAEFESQKKAISDIIADDSKWRDAADKLAALKLNKITRQTPVEALYDVLVYSQNHDQRLLEGRYTWTLRQSSHGYLVNVGRFGSSGMVVSRWAPGYSGGGLGVCLSR